jgi:hypothetical protein
MILWLVGAALAQESGSGSGSGSGTGSDSGGDSRDDEIFGTATPPPPPAVPPAPDESLAAPDTPLDQEIRSDQSISEQLAAKDERLTFGGMLYLREDGAFGSDATSPEDVDLASPSLFDLFADVNPNDRIRGYAQGRLEYDWTISEGQIDPLTGEELQRADVLLDQLWIKADVARKVFLTVGKQRIKWGAGRFWNPTDFLNTERLDALAVFDERTGVALVKAHVPLGTWNAYAIANLERTDQLDAAGGAARLEALVGNTEITASMARGRTSHSGSAPTCRAGSGLFDLYAEGALLHGDDLHTWEGTLAEGAPLPTKVDRSDDWIPQVTAGARSHSRSATSTPLSLGVEGFYNGLGYDDPDLYPGSSRRATCSSFTWAKRTAPPTPTCRRPGAGSHVSFTGS